MKITYIKTFALAAITALSFASCDDFLDKPTEDLYVGDNYYQTDEQCYSGVNYLYNAPWYDFLRGYFEVGEVLSGNLYMGNSQYLTFTLNGTDPDLVNMSNSLWSEIGHCSTVYNYIKNCPASASAKNDCMGQILTLKALAYFYLVRAFGEIPIIHDNTAALKEDYNSFKKAKKADVYEYIIMTLEKAMELLPKSARDAGRVDYYSAEALLAKVYLTKAGVSGTLDQSDLDNAAKYAKDVIDNSGRNLLPNYSDNFRLEYNHNEESLIAWQWSCLLNDYTAQNCLQSDLAWGGFDEWNCWGDWRGITFDLQEAFGIKIFEQQPDTWINHVDTRLRATMMLPGFTYEYFWKDHTLPNGNGNGFDFLHFIYDKNYNSTAPGEMRSPTGASNVKHLHGDNYDHKAALGYAPPDQMRSSLATHVLRLADIYLVYAESKLHGPGSSTTDAEAIDAYYTVRNRAIKSATRPSSITWDDVWKERRLELAMEGDRWYDFVRISYYNPDFCINELLSQNRVAGWGLDNLAKEYYTSGTWSVTENMGFATESPINPASLMKKDADSGKMYFFIPMPTNDVASNPNLGSNVDGEHVDVRSTYSY